MKHSNPGLVDRRSWILSQVQGKSVLHLGATDSPFTQLTTRKRPLLHEDIQAAAANLVGIDLDEEAIEWLQRNRGIFDILPGDIEVADQYPPGLYEVILAGEILEHLSNPGLALNALRRHLGDSGVLLLTVPNSTSLKAVLRAIFSTEIVHRDHVAYFSPRTMTALLSRHGLQVTSISFYCAPPASRVARLANYLLRLRPMLAEGLCVAAVKDQSQCD